MPLRPPMPQFRMSVEDAKAVVAYLKSLQSAALKPEELARIMASLCTYSAS